MKRLLRRTPATHEHVYRTVGMTEKNETSSYPGHGASYYTRPVLVMACECGDTRWKYVSLDETRRSIA